MRKTTYKHIKNYLLIILFSGLTACSATPDYKTPIVEYLETHKGVRTDLKVEFKSFEVSDIFVSDSIQILQDVFEIKKAENIKDLLTSIERLKASIAKQEESKNQVVAKSLIRKWSEELSKLEADLIVAQNQKDTSSEKYSSHNTSEILAKKVKAEFSFFNPQLQTKQELKADFILSPDGTKCNKMIK